jgi:hypothetical protein
VGAAQPEAQDRPGDGRDSGGEPAQAAPKAKATPKAKPAAGKRARPPSRSRRSAEPLDEIVLSARAKQLAAWVEKHPHRTAANVDHWLYQHTWIVTGQASAGRRRAALRTLIAVDRPCAEALGVGAQASRSPARRSPRSGALS